MKQFQKDVKRYIRGIGRTLAGTKADEKKFLKEYETSIYEYMEEENMKYDYNMLVEKFGTPEAVCCHYIEAFYSEVQARKVKNRKRLLIVSCICIILVLIFLGLYFYLFANAASHYISGYYLDSTILLPL